MNAAGPAGQLYALFDESLLTLDYLRDLDHLVMFERDGVRYQRKLRNLDPEHVQAIREATQGYVAPVIISQCVDCGLGTFAADEWYVVTNEVWELAWAGRRKPW
jgi:hypothetical protein